MNNDSKDFKEEDFIKVMEALVDAFKPKTEQEEFQRFKSLFNENTREVLDDIFTGYFAFMEGSGFSRDKGRATANALIKSVENGKNIELQYTYLEYRDKGRDLGGLASRSDEELNHMCYWCPETVKDTRTAMDIYFIVVNLRLKKLQDLITAYKNKKNDTTHVEEPRKERR